MIDKINRDHKYLIEIYDDIKVDKIIRNVSAVNSRISPEAVSKAIFDSGIVTCPVGPNNLKYIAKILLMPLAVDIQIKLKKI